MKILKEAGMEDCNPALCPTEPGLKLSKAKDGCLRYLLHTRPDLTYSVGVISRYIQSPRESRARAIKQILRYLKGSTSFGIKYKRGNDMRLVGYSSHNVDIDDGRSTTKHVFYLAEFMVVTATACQAIWLREVLADVTENEQDFDMERKNEESYEFTNVVHKEFGNMKWNLVEMPWNDKQPFTTKDLDDIVSSCISECVASDHQSC
ncbi:uncharacterized mitochondrial protein-like protein [Tanacetum coccineum]